MRIRKHWFVLLLVLVSAFPLSVVLAGCGDDKTTSEEVGASEDDVPDEYDNQQPVEEPDPEPELIARGGLVFRNHSRFTMAQRMAELRAMQAKRHPQWSALSRDQMEKRLEKLIAEASSPSSPQPPLAPFLGNNTVISSPSGSLVGLMRQSNCSLTMGYGTYTLNFPSVNYDIPSTTVNYGQVLHNEAGLTTTGGVWPEGCVDSNLGIASGPVVPLGVTSAGQLVGAATAYDPFNSANVLLTFDGSIAGSNTISLGGGAFANSSVIGLAAGDLNGDGTPDLVVVNTSTATGGSATLAVILGNADGSFQTATSYTLPGSFGISAVIDDFNGDGKPDIVVSTAGTSSGSKIYSLSFLAGNGDGTFQAPEYFNVTPPSGFQGSAPYFGLISSDLLGNGKKDLVTSAGIVFLGNGKGIFDQSSTLAFPATSASTSYGPDVVAADFNKDGKMDLAVDNGRAISIYLGDGTGNFTAGASYASINNSGVLTAADLDGDGNVDLYSGTARAGLFGGDSYTYNLAYALMGNGDGTFQGAPELPFVVTGTNLAKLTSNPTLDGVGVTADQNTSTVSMVSYLGNGSGTFTAGPTLPVSPVMIQGKSYSFNSLDSYGLGDITGDGKVDLAYLAEAGSDYGPKVGYFLATGNGDGSFNAPTFIVAPTFAPSGDLDEGETLSNLFVADINGDGKADVVYSYSLQDFTSGVFEQGIAVQLSNSDGTFQAPQVIQTYSSTTAPPGNPPQVIYIGDATGSGKLDLVTMTTTLSIVDGTGVTTYAMQLYLGNGDGTFGSALTPPVADNLNPPVAGTAIGQVALADMNGDGKPDLITLGTTNNGNSSELAIAIGNGDGTFQTPTIVDFGHGSSLYFGLAVADFNGDGKLDVAVAGFDPPDDTGIFIGNGDGTVQTATSSSGVAEPSESIDLALGGITQAVNLSGGTGLPDLISGAALVYQAPLTAALISTSTALTASASSVAVGQNETFTATVSASGSTPAGSVTFYDGTSTLGTGTLNGSGVATYSTSSLGLGAHSITATYQGNSTYAASTSTPADSVTVTEVTLTSTNTTLTASASTVSAGANVMLNATVAPTSGSGTPTGSVSFMDGTNTLAVVSLSSGAASYSTTTLAVGVHSITAVYSGDSNFSGSTSAPAYSVTVTAATPTSTNTTLSASPSTVSAGANVMLSATVAPTSGSGTPTGSVSFMDGTNTLAVVSLSSGAASYSTTTLAVGVHSITAVYSGDSNFSGSTSTPAYSVTVTAATPTSTNTTLSASASTVSAGASVMLNVTVAPTSGSGTPTGTVSFTSGGTTLAMISLSNGAASYSTTSLPVGADAISAVYSGDANFSGSTSNAITVTVQALVPSFTFSASPATGTVTAGSTAQTTITVTPLNGFNSPVSFACSGLPTGATCSFSPSTVTPSGSSASTTLSVTTTTQSAALVPSGSHRDLRGGVTLAFLMGGALWLFRRRKNLRLPLMLPIVIGCLALATMLSGCNHSKSKSSSQSATALITVAATAGSETQNTTYTLTVQQ